MATQGDGRVIELNDLLQGVKLEYNGRQHRPMLPPEPEECTPPPAAAHPLAQVATALIDSFYCSSWCLDIAAAEGPAAAAAAAAAGVPHDVYTAALRGALLEWGADPVATLPTRLRAAEQLSALLGVGPDVHEALLLRALSANENIVMELLTQAAALRNHKVGITPDDFVSRDVYLAWRQQALCAVRALLLAQQSMPDYNALLEVSLLSADGLVNPKKGGGFWCCATPPEPLSPYTWASLITGAGAGAVTASLGTRMQRTEVAEEAGPEPVWRTQLQPLSLKNEDCELRFKVQHCDNETGRPIAARDTVVGVSGVKMPALQTGLRMQLGLPLFKPPAARDRPAGGGGSPTSESDSNTFFRVVYNAHSDFMEGSGGLPQQGRLQLQVRYIVERRERCHVPDELDLLQEDDAPYDMGDDEGYGGYGNGQGLPQGGGVDYRAYLGQALIQGLGESPLAYPAALQSFVSRFHTADVQLMSQPLPDSAVKPVRPIDPVRLVKQLAAALGTATRSGFLPTGAVELLGALPALPLIPVELQPLLLSPKPRNSRGGTRRSPVPARKPWETGASPPTRGPPQEDNSIQVVWRLVSDALVRPYLPWGPALPIMLRACLMLGIRGETILLLVMQHMLDLWPNFISHCITLRGTKRHTNAGAVEEGGAQDYLYALKAVWEPCLRWHAAGTLTKDETEGVKAVMGLLLSRALPALEHHYTVFVGQEGATCFSMLVELVGWAWTWDPDKETPLAMLADCLKDAAKSRMATDFRPSTQTIVQDVEAVAAEVQAATLDYQRDKDIQLAFPGLRGCAASNASVRYGLITDHLEALVLYQPGASKAAVQAMFRLEEALLEHHALLVSEGLAEALPPPAVPHHLKPRKVAPGSRDASLSGVASELEEVMSVSWEDGPGTQASTARTQAARRAPQIKRAARHAPTIPLWDWEPALIEELGRWVRAGASELQAAMLRLVAAETWEPVSREAGVASSALELSRLIEASLAQWVDAACSGSEARRLSLGVLITACLVHVIAQYVEATTAAWDKELDLRAAIFSGTPAGATPAAKSAPIDPDDDPTISRPWVPPQTNGPGGPVATNGAMVRVMSLAVGLQDTVASRHGGLYGVEADLMTPPPASAATGPAGPAHHHKRSRSRPTLPGVTGGGGVVWKDLAGLRTQLSTALEAQPGLCLTNTMCVIRCTLLKVSQEARDLGAHLLQHLIAPSLADAADLQPAASVASSAGGAGGGSTGDRLSPGSAVGGRPSVGLGGLGGPKRSTGTSSDEDEDMPAGRPALASMRGSLSAQYRHGGPGGGGGGGGLPGADEPWARRKPLTSTHSTTLAEDPGWGRKRNAAPANGHATGTGAGGGGGGGGWRDRDREPAGLPPRNSRPSNGKLSTTNDVQPIYNYVGLYWQELHRRTSAAITSMISGYSMQIRSILVSMMVAACGITPGDEPDPNLLQGMMRALDDELIKMGSGGLGGHLVLLVEAAGAVWRSTMSALQLMALNQAGFRPASEEECELLRELLTSMQRLFQEEVPRLAREAAAAQGLQQPRPSTGEAEASSIVDMAQLPDPLYPQRLAAQLNNSLPAFAVRQYSTLRGQAATRLTPELLASLNARLPPELPDSSSSSAAGRGSSAEYCSALLQVAAAPTSVLQDLYKAQEACLHAVQSGDSLYLQLGAQQLPLLDLLRLLRARRKVEGGAGAWADAQMKDSSAIITQVLFGLVSSERVVAEARCQLAGASRAQGRLIITQNTLNFTTLLDADAKGTTDTTLSIPRAKVVSASQGQEQGSMVLSTTDYDILAFCTFVPPSERDRIITLLRTAPTPVAPAPAPKPPSPPPTASSTAANGSGPGAGGPQPMGGLTRSAAARPGGARGPSDPGSHVGRPGPANVPFSASGGLGHSAGAARAAAAAGGDAGGGARVRPGAPRDSWAEREAAKRAELEAVEAARFGLSFSTGPPPGALRAASSGSVSSVAASMGAASSGTAGSAIAGVTGPRNDSALIQAPDRGDRMADRAPVPRPPARQMPAAAAASPPKPVSNQPLMSVPCALHGKLRNTQGLLVLYGDRLEFTSTADAQVLHKVPLTDVAAVTQQTTLISGTMLIVKVDEGGADGRGSTQLGFLGLSDALIASMKQSIVDLT